MKWGGIILISISNFYPEQQNHYDDDTPFLVFVERRWFGGHDHPSIIYPHIQPLSHLFFLKFSLDHLFFHSDGDHDLNILNFRAFQTRNVNKQKIIESLLLFPPIFLDFSESQK